MGTGGPGFGLAVLIFMAGDAVQEGARMILISPPRRRGPASQVVISAVPMCHTQDAVRRYRKWATCH